MVRLWPLDETAIVDHICATAGDPITEQEWGVYLPDISYDPPCDRQGG